MDDGYITAPFEKASYQVGILQDDDGNTFVLAVWTGFDAFGNGGTFYETYLWTPTGLTLSSGPNEIVVGGLGSSFPSGRVSLDCYGLRKAVVAFDEDLSSGGTPGYINACVFTMGASLTLSNTIYVAGTAGVGQFPDVTLGNNGNTVRIAFTEAPSPITPPHDIIVSSISFATIAAAADGAVVPFTLDDVLSSATSEVASHLHIDCPDNFGSDIWSLAYLQNPTRVMSRTKRTSGVLVSTLLSTSPYAGYASPAVSYGQNGNIIVYGWYSSDQNTYIATQLQNNGTTFIFPTIAGAFFDIPSTSPFTPAFTTHKNLLAFSTNSNNTRLSMGYLAQDLGSPPYYDFRSKNISWLPATMRGEGFLPFENNKLLSVAAVPNPFTQKISLSVHPYNGEAMSIRMVDITGKVLLELQGQDLYSVNHRLDEISYSLPSGNYFINVDMEEVHNTLKIVKLK